MRSKASRSATPSPAAPTNSWAMWGAPLARRAPQAPSSTGTSRQPSTRWPSASTAALDQLDRALGAASSCGQEAHAPRRSRPAAGSSRPASARRKASGIWMQDARAVARVRVGALGAAVLEAARARTAPARSTSCEPGAPQARDEGDAAGVVLVARVVQAGHCLQGSSPPRIPRLLRAGARRAGARNYRATGRRKGRYTAYGEYRRLTRGHDHHVLSQKGGTGKTTTVRTLADVFRRAGLEVLCVDLDPQGNLSDYFDVPADASPTVADVLAGPGQGGRRGARGRAAGQPRAWPRPSWSWAARWAAS